MLTRDVFEVLSNKDYDVWYSETWTMKEGNDKFLNVFERKVLRLIYGSIYIVGEVRKRQNEELYTMRSQQIVIKPTGTR